MRCLLHIGTHKTGTTSIQHFLRHHIGEPSYPPGLIYHDSHSEPANLAIRVDQSDIASTHPESVTDPWRQQVTRRIRAQVTSEVDWLIYSSEHLSLLCHADEIAAVMDVLEGRQVEVVMYTRNPADFLESYAFTIRMFGLGPPTRPDAINDLSPETWLVDYQSRIDLWAEHAPVTVVDYDEVVARDGSVIPSFAALLGIAPVEYRLNSTMELQAEIIASINRDPEAMQRLAREIAAMDDQPD